MYLYIHGQIGSDFRNFHFRPSQSSTIPNTIDLRHIHKIEFIYEYKKSLSLLLVDDCDFTKEK